MNWDLLLPFTDCVEVTPSDTVDLDQPSVGLSCAGAGTVAAITMEGNDRTFHLMAGNVQPIRVRRVKATGTTATGIRAWYN